MDYWIKKEKMERRKRRTKNFFGATNMINIVEQKREALFLTNVVSVNSVSKQIFCNDMNQST